MADRSNEITVTKPAAVGGDAYEALRNDMQSGHKALLATMWQMQK